ncbi:MAG: lysine exporter LysO family protein [Oscillospiraceae bacterium]
MIIIATISLLLGIVVGNFLSPDIIFIFSKVASIALLLLMFSVGISIGMDKLIFRKMRDMNFKVLFVPLGIVVGSLFGGFVCSLIMDNTIREGLAISSGLGWYSLSGVVLTELAGAEVGTVAFMSSLFREILSFLIIPIVAKYTAGATSEDTTLPIIMKCTSEEIVIVSVINGIVCSALVPILINMIYTI